MFIRGLFLALLAVVLPACKKSSGGDDTPGPAGPATIRMSVSTLEIETNSDSFSYARALSSDGRYCVFESGANNLVGADANATTDVFFRDATEGTTARVSVDSAGAEADGPSITPAISESGRYVAFASSATNLVASDGNAASDIFVRDLQLNTTARVSLTDGDAECNGASLRPALSSDGRYVAFQSIATNLVTGDTNGLLDVFVRDTVANTTIRASLTDADAESAGASFGCSISGDGRYVTFESTAADLVTGDTNGQSDIFLRDTTGGTTVRVSVSTAGAEATGGSDTAVLSGDGQFVVFQSGAPDLVAADANGLVDIFVRDTVGSTTTRVSVTTAGVEAAGGGSFSASVSADGRYVTFASDATNLVTGDTNGATDLFVRDTVSGTTVRVSVSTGGSQASLGSYGAAISGDGRFIAFQSDAFNLVTGDANGNLDIFRRGPQF